MSHHPPSGPSCSPIALAESCLDWFAEGPRSGSGKKGRSTRSAKYYPAPDRVTLPVAFVRSRLRFLPVLPSLRRLALHEQILLSPCLWAASLLGHACRLGAFQFDALRTSPCIGCSGRPGRNLNAGTIPWWRLSHLACFVDFVDGYKARCQRTKIGSQLRVASISAPRPSYGFVEIAVDVMRLCQYVLRKENAGI